MTATVRMDNTPRRGADITTSVSPPSYPTLVLIIGAGILWVAFALRVFRLGDANIWWDEGLAIWAIRHSFTETTRWTACDVHPPLYFWTLWPWTRLVGESEFAARFITVIVGLLTVALLAPLGRRLGGWQVGLLAAGLLATARFHVWWSQEMRMYTLAALLHVASLLALIIWWSSRSRRAWLAYVLASVGGLYTIYLSAVILVAHNVWVGGRLLALWTADGRRQTADREPRTTEYGPPTDDGPPSAAQMKPRELSGQRSAVGRRLAAWVAAQLTILALFIPWFAYAAGCMSSWSVAEPISFPFVLQLQATLLTLGISTNIDAVLPLVIGLVLLLTVGVAVLARQRAARPGVALLILVLALPSLVIFALALPRGLFYNPRVEARYFLPFAPPVYILLAWGLWALWQKRRAVGVAALGVLLGAFAWSLPQHYTDRYLRDDLQGMVQVLRAYARPDDRVLLVSGNRYPVFLYYYERGMPADRPLVEEVPGNALELAPDNVDRELRRVTRDQSRVWLAWVNGPLQDPQALAPAWLKQNYKTSLSYGFDHNSLTLFTPDGAPPPLVQRPLATDGPTIIQGYDVPTREYRPGDIARLGLYYDGPAVQARVGLTPLDRTIQPLPVSRPVQLGPGPMRAQVELPILPFMGGRYRLSVETDQGGDSSQTSTLKVRDGLPDGPPQTRLAVNVGDAIQLTGLSIVDERGEALTQLRPGATVYADLFWAATDSVNTDYTVFVHLLGSAFNPVTGGPVWAGHDSPPANGLYPTSWWAADTRLRDRHPLELPTDLPPGEYQLEIGMYDATGARLPTSGGQADPAQRRILGPTLRVE